MLSHIQQALRANIADRAERVGPFLIQFDDHNDNPFFNYAIPDDGACPTSQEIADLVAAMARRSRRARLEYVVPAPAIEQALGAAGFQEDLRLTIMSVTPGQLTEREVAPDLTVVQLGADDELMSAARVQHIAYGEPAEAGSADVDRLRALLRRGGGLVLASCGGEAAGAGTFSPPQHGLSEISGVGVLPKYRQRHLASAIAATLTRAVFAVGAMPYLQTESENEERLYGQLGYQAVGQLVAASLP